MSTINARRKAKSRGGEGRGAPRHVVALVSAEGTAFPEASRGALRELLSAAEAAGLPCGFLVLREPAVPEELWSPAAAGARRCAVVGRSGSLSFKPRRGPAVLRDLLREHFLGCEWVLVEGAQPGSMDLRLEHRVDAAGQEWCLSCDDGARLELKLEQLLERLRRPRPCATDREAGD